MKSFLRFLAFATFIVGCLFMVAHYAKAADKPPIAPPVENPVAPPVDWTADHNNRVEKMTKTIDGMLATIDTMDYNSAYAQAVKTGKPLLVWVGDARCDRCTKATMAEFVHHRASSFYGSTQPRVVVSLPKNGELIWIGDVTNWITGDPVFGHIPSTKRLIERHKNPPPPVFVQPQMQAIPQQVFQNQGICFT